MARKKRSSQPETKPRLLRFGLVAATVLPHILFIAASSEAIRESKILFLGLGAALALPAVKTLRLSIRGPLAFLAGALGLAALSAVTTGARWVDPLLLALLLPAGALLVAGASDEGHAARDVVFDGLMAAGALTGLLAFGQRFLGFWRMPVAAPEPRFLATGFIGNPGDVGAALVVPALLFWIAFSEKRRTVLSAIGLVCCLLGLGASQSVGPLAAFASGVTVHLALDIRRRARLFAVGAAVVIVAAFATGLGQRALVKLREVAKGDLAAASTQRDIGVLAAREMIARHPFLGVGPGCFENAFVPARIAAEERTRRRLVHLTALAHFENAHSEPLTIAAECGLPATALSLAFAAALVVSLFRRRSDPDAATLLILLASFLVLCAGGFPLRLAILLGPAAYFTGLALRGVESPRAVPRLVTFPAALAILVVCLARWMAVSFQAAGEDSLRASGVADGIAKRDILTEGGRALSASLALRPRKPQTWLALGSTQRLLGDLDAAWQHTTRSFFLEERVEADVNLGVLCLMREARASDSKEKLQLAQDASLLLRRAVWILPQIVEFLPPAAQPAEAQRVVESMEKDLPRTGAAPALPESLRQKL